MKIQTINPVKNNEVKIFSRRAFNVAQRISRNAVDGGSKNGFEFDWFSAMTLLKVAYGRYDLDFGSEYYES